MSIIIFSSLAYLSPRTTLQLPRYPRSQYLAPPLIAAFSTDIFAIPPSALVSRQCERQKLVSHEYHARYATNQTFSNATANGAFDDILLIVFFSHARYDVNLDLYRAAYSPYFPNVCA